LNSKKPKKSVFEVAAEVFHRKGYDNTSMSDVATAAGLTKAGLYHYIQSKERLLFEIMGYAMDRVEAEVIAPAKQIADPEQRVRSIVTTYAQLVLERGQEMTMVVNEVTGLNREHHKKISARRRAFYEFFRAAIEDLKSVRSLDMDTSVTALSVFGIIMWMAHWYRPGGRLSKELVRKEITRLVVDRLFG